MASSINSERLSGFTDLPSPGPSRTASTEIDPKDRPISTLKRVAAVANLMKLVNPDQ